MSSRYMESDSFLLRKKPSMVLLGLAVDGVRMETDIQ
jgi:hypothetical protein